MSPVEEVYAHTPRRTTMPAETGDAGVSVVDWIVTGAWLPRVTVLLLVAALRPVALTVATGPSAEARAVTPNANGCIVASGAKVSAAPLERRANPARAERRGRAFPLSSASKSEGTKVVISSLWPEALG